LIRIARSNGGIAANPTIDSGRPPAKKDKVIGSGIFLSINPNYSKKKRNEHIFGIVAYGHDVVQGTLLSA